jgi:hypothetical protein
MVTRMWDTIAVGVSPTCNNVINEHKFGRQEMSWRSYYEQLLVQHGFGKHLRVDLRFSIALDLLSAKEPERILPTPLAHHCGWN